MAPLKLGKEKHNKVFAENYEGKTVHIFVSYSSIEKGIAGSIKDFLEKSGLSVFLAHEDIRPTDYWQEEIVRNLKSCDIFMPLLTVEFCHSEWTDQETGMAVALNKFVIPLKMGKDPYGLIGKVQACKFNEKNIKDSCLEIIRLIKDKSPFQESLKDCLLRSLENANNFDTASPIIQQLEEFETFTKEQINQILRISIRNNQVRMCSDGQEFLKSIVKKYNSEIDPGLKEIYKKVKDSFGSPVKNS